MNAPTLPITSVDWQVCDMPSGLQSVKGGASFVSKAETANSESPKSITESDLLDPSCTVGCALIASNEKAKQLYDLSSAPCQDVQHHTIEMLKESKDNPRRTRESGKRAASKRRLLEMIAHAMVSATVETDTDSTRSASTARQDGELIGSFLHKGQLCTPTKGTSQRSAFDGGPSSKSQALPTSVLPPSVPRRRRSNALEEALDLVELPKQLPLHQPPTSPLLSIAGHSVRRSASARTSNNEKIMTKSVRRMLSRRISAGEMSPSQDMQPRKPSRRGSARADLEKLDENELLENITVGSDMMPQAPDSGRSLGLNSSGSSSGSTTTLKAAEIESFVMARIPEHVKEKLPPEAWSRIFSAAVETYVSSSSSTGSCDSRGVGSTSVDKIPASPTELKPDEASSGVSPIAHPTALFSKQTESSPLNVPPSPVVQERNYARFTRTADSSPFPPTIPFRSGHTPTVEHASRAPQRHITTRWLSDPYPYPESPRPKTKKRNRKRNVSFNTVHVRQYERILEAHPCTSSGPSMGIGWRYEEDSPVKLGDIRPPRSSRHFILPRHTRERMLAELGYTKREIAQSVRRTVKTKSQRKQTVNNLHIQRMEYMVERSRRKVSRTLRSAMKGVGISS